MIAAAVLVTLLASAGVVQLLRSRAGTQRQQRRRQDAINDAARQLAEKERFDWDYRSGRYQRRGSIPRTLDPSLMTLKERARMDNGIGEFSPEGRYLDPPEHAWDR
jgi:hypothetical protein